MITENSIVIITKGSRSYRGLDIAKGVSATVLSVEVRERNEVRLVLKFRNGMHANKTVSVYVRHTNRLADAEVQGNSGDPTCTLRFKAKA